MLIVQQILHGCVAIGRIRAEGALNNLTFTAGSHGSGFADAKRPH
jgi:hypothetical protein